MKLSKVLEINKIHCMDSLQGLKLLDDNSIDSCITDPPYNLTTTKRWGNDIAFSQNQSDVGKRFSKGFMGKEWDGTGISFSIELWSEVLRILKPGGHLLSFGGSRTYHRMACAIEDAGFEIRDQIMWVYGSGFPKSLNIGKAVDKLQGNEREIINEQKRKGRSCGILGKETDIIHINDKGASEWEGWGTALKPAHEPIVLARKPLSENTVAENVLKWGTGGLNIDGCRIETKELTPRNNNNTETLLQKGFEGEPKTIYPSSLGRFPANLIHDGSKEVMELFPETKSIPHTHDHKKDTIIYGGGKGLGIRKGDSLFNESGSASRFFYCAKASKEERDKGLRGIIPETEMPYGSGGGGMPSGNDNPDKTFLRNIHPTVKPLSLMEYLIKLITKENQLVLDPFIGSGTTALACKKINRSFIGFEISQEYVDIANKRLRNIPDRLENYIL